MQCEFSLISDILFCSDTSPTPSPLLLLPASSLCSGASSIIRSYSTQRGIQICCTLFNHHLYIFCDQGGRLPDAVEGLVVGRGLLASSLLLPPLCHHGPVATESEQSKVPTSFILICAGFITSFFHHSFGFEFSRVFAFISAVFGFDKTTENVSPHSICNQSCKKRFK